MPRGFIWSALPGLGLRNGPTPLTQAHGNLSESCAVCGHCGRAASSATSGWDLIFTGDLGREGGGGTGPAKIYGVE